MTHVLAFLLGVIAPWTVRFVVESAREGRDVWRSPEWYVDDRFNYDGLTWAGRCLVRAALFFKGRRPPDQEEP